MITKVKYTLSVFLLIGLVTACRASTPMPQASLTAVATVTPEATVPSALRPSTPTPVPTATPVIEVEPTSTPRPGDSERISIGSFPIGQPGSYVNVTFGYQLHYPPTWYTGFGSRPLLVSFSNLDPGMHNRLSMRAEGCLIEVRASTNVYGLTLQSVRGQLPRAFRNAEEIDLGGELALRVQQSSEENPFESEVIYVDHADRLFVITFESATGAAEICRPAWENLLNTWQWFEPEFAIYRNPSYGYTISHPRRWYRFDVQERGVSISSQDPTGLTDFEEAVVKGAMLVKTNVFDNPEMFPLKEWLAERDWATNLTNDIPIRGLIGVRMLREGPVPEIQQMSGYFQGPLGKIYEVTCLYPADRQWEFRPIANAIIYSFSF